MKRIIKTTSLILGSALVVLPTISMFSCARVEIEHFKILPTYTGQADQLIALGIKPDYYPYQLNQTSAYSYITNPKEQMTWQVENNPEFANAFSSKISSLYNGVPKGRSWWNQSAEKADNTNPSSEYWTRKRGDFVLYEHYLLDDDKKVLDSDQSPQYRVAVETNFRMSQDPYTRLSKKIIDESLDSKNTTEPLALEFQKVFGLRDEKGIVDSMWDGDRPMIDRSKWDTSSDYFDDAYFAYVWHSRYLDNPLLAPGGQAESFSNFILNADGGVSQNVFHADDQKNLILARLFDKATINHEDPLLNSTSYLKAIEQPNIGLRHHPIYDAQTEVGEAPMFEGSRRDNMLYLYQLASAITNKFNGRDDYGIKQDGSLLEREMNYLRDSFKDDSRLPLIDNALVNANKIAGNLNQRLIKVKEYIKSIGLEGKTFAIVTVEPGGGISTVQTNSKFDFLLDKIGLNVPVPNDFDSRYANVTSAQNVREDQVAAVNGNKTLFSMDDNGWFWDFGNMKDDFENAKLFEGTSDFGVVTIRPLERKALKDNHIAAFKNIYKSRSENAFSYVNYDLWNEGIKTPFALNMVIDQFLDIVSKQSDITNEALKNEAYYWGDYWTKDYLS